MKRFFGQPSIKSPFPTWSWASRRGKIDVPNEPRYNSYESVENLVPCDGVRCYMLEIDQSEGKYLRLINETGGWRFTSGYVRKGGGNMGSIVASPDQKGYFARPGRDLRDT